MASQSASADDRRATLRRDRGAAVVAGVCAGIARQLGIDVLVVRIAFIALAFAGGLGAALYALLWAFVPVEGGASVLGGRRLTGRGAVEIGLGVSFLVLSFLLALRGLGIWWSDSIVWPLVLIAGGAALLWRGGDAGVADAPLQA